MDWSVELFEKEIKNSVLKIIFSIIITTFIFIMLVIFSALLIIPHLILRIIDRHGFFKKTFRSFNVTISSKSFKKVES